MFQGEDASNSDTVRSSVAGVACGDAELFIQGPPFVPIILFAFRVREALSKKCTPFQELTMAQRAEPFGIVSPMAYT